MRPATTSIPCADTHPLTDTGALTLFSTLGMAISESNGSPLFTGVKEADVNTVPDSMRPQALPVT